MPMPSHGESSEQQDGIVEGIVNQVKPRESPSNFCIYRVPEKLRKLNEEAYTPQIVSIGPFHCKKNLRVSDTDKGQYLRSFVRRNSDVRLESYDRVIKPMADDIRQRYAEINEEITSITSDEFVKMMLLDGCFILEFLIRNSPGEKRRTGDPLSDNPWYSNAIKCDLMLLENQLPFCVLDELYNLNKKEGLGDSLSKLVRDSFSHMVPKVAEQVSDKKLDFKGYCTQVKQWLISSSSPSYEAVGTPDSGSSATITISTVHQRDIASSDVRHLLHFVLRLYISSSVDDESQTHAADPKCGIQCCRAVLTTLCCLPDPHPQEEKPKKPLELPPNVTKLGEAGVKFKVSTKGNWLSGISFKNGILTIPRIDIEDRTESLFRNMIAFEQFHNCVDRSKHFTDFATLMSSLVDSSKDVAMLREQGIITSLLGDNEQVSQLFNKIAKEVIIGGDDFYFAETCKDLNNYYRSSWHAWMANLKYKYFSTPWSTISFLAAALLLALAIVQTIYTIKS